MTVKLNMIRDINGFNSFGLVPSDDDWNTTLAAGVVQTFTVPSKFDSALAIFAFEPGSTIWCAFNQTAAVPGVSVATSTSELNPTAWKVIGGNTITMVTNDTTAEVGIKYYDLQQ